MKEFTYFVRNGKNKNTPDNEIYCEYYPEDKRNHFIIWSFKTKKYYSFQCYENALKYINKLKQSDRNFCEVIFGQRSQRIKFDIDIDGDNLSKFNEIYDNNDEIFLHQIKNTIHILKDRLYGDTKFKSEKLDFIICTAHSHHFELSNNNNNISTNNKRRRARRTKKVKNTESESEEKPKKSFHIILNNYCVKNSVEVSYFTRSFLDIYKELYKDDEDCCDLIKHIIDVSINNRNKQNIRSFRLVGNSKVGSNRIKKIISGHSIDDTIIQNIDGLVELPEKAKTSVYPKKTVTTDVDLEKALQLLRDKYPDILENFQFRDFSNNIVSFDRIN